MTQSKVEIEERSVKTKDKTNVQQKTKEQKDLEEK